MKLTWFRKGLLLVWLFLLAAIAVYPPKKFTYAGPYGSVPETPDQAWVYLGKSPERWSDGAIDRIGSSEFYTATDPNPPNEEGRSTGGTIRAAEIDAGRLLAEWMIVSAILGTVWILLPQPREPADVNTKY